MKKIAQGAEAIIYREKDKIIKLRIPKKYRIKKLDEKLRKYRNRRESKILSDMRRIKVNVPEIIHSGNDDDYKISMKFIDGKKIAEILNRKNCENICKNIGIQISKIHEFGVVHGDLTTSNMILNKNKNGNKIYFIDFGLGKYSKKIEDRAVDLVVFKECLKSAHTKIFERCWKSFLNGYKNYSKFNDVMKRIETIEKRRRYT